MNGVPEGAAETAVASENLTDAGRASGMTDLAGGVGTRWATIRDEDSKVCRRSPKDSMVRVREEVAK